MVIIQITIDVRNDIRFTFDVYSKIHVQTTYHLDVWKWVSFDANKPRRRS